MDEQILITISGPIGVGKSDFAELLSEEFGYDYHPEEVSSPEDIEVLNQYYWAVGELIKETNPQKTIELRKTVLNTQKYFIRKRAKSLEEITREGRNAVLERDPDDDIHIFSQDGLNHDRLTELEFNEIVKYAHTKTQNLIKPSLRVFLVAYPFELRKRIAKRGRESEKSLLYPHNPYLNDQFKLHMEFYGLYDKPKLICNNSSFKKPEETMQFLFPWKKQSLESYLLLLDN